MVLPWIELRPAPNCGVGLFAARPIARGTITMIECPACGRISRQDAERSPRRDFIFSHAPITATSYPDFLAGCDPRMDYGNHSCDANTLDTQLGFDIAVRDIESDEALTVDYRRFLDSTIAFSCRCGAPACCREVRCAPPPLALAAMWQRRLSGAFRRARVVNQPLLRSSGSAGVRRLIADWLAGTREGRGTYRGNLD